MPEIGQPVPPLKAYHPVTAAGYLYDGGFRYGHGIVTMLATAWAESDLGAWMRGPLDFKTDPPILKGNADGSIDRGWLMFNSKGHPEVTDLQADDPALAAKQAWRVTEHGERFSQWAAFSTGRYRVHMPAARAYVALYHLLERGVSLGRVADIALYRP